MAAATLATVSRPERFSSITALNFQVDDAASLAAELAVLGVLAWKCRRGGLVVLHGARRVRLVHDQGAPPASLKAVVNLVEAAHHSELIGRPPMPPTKRKARSVAAAGLLK